jgi:hypothetical protein
MRWTDSTRRNGRTFDASTRAALEQKLGGAAPTTPTVPQAPQGDYEKMVADAIANAPKDNASLRPYWTKFAAEVAPRLEALGVSREQIKKTILWGLGLHLRVMVVSSRRGVPSTPCLALEALNAGETGSAARRRSARSTPPRCARRR